ncbi:hypothetical protein BDQ12DRAFT_724055 [Crucibulum laeve]|uniref:DUF6533 domain-containing protein n=1 Tax=Crucibulum laeve TaxID=68775 RepID=A0A5C3LYW3_9AGAR|nr:hypothetical protein BDQ12DRAFT_724055 [Crucibulum laeve]
MDLETLVEQGTAVNLVAASCLTCLLYDHAITLDQEVARMWPARLSAGKLLFFINRYVLTRLDSTLRHNAIVLHLCYCVFYLRWLTVTTTISTSVVQGILMLRVWALHRRNKAALYVGYFFYFGGVATLIGLVVKDYIGEDVIINDALSSLPGCYATTVPSIIAGFWIAPLIVESVLFILVVSRAFIWWKNGSSTPRILSILARDSTIYFAVVFALLLANYLMFELGPPFLSSLLVSPSTTAGCILGSHMLLNLRELANPDDDPIGSAKTHVVFALPSRRVWETSAMGLTVGSGTRYIPSKTRGAAMFS